MKILKKFDLCILINVSFYAFLLLIPAFSMDLTDYSTQAGRLFSDNLSNSIIYLTPVAMAVFLKIKKLENANIINLIYNLLLLVFLYTEINHAAGSHIHLILAITVFSFMLIHSGFASVLILLPGFFMTRLIAADFLLLAYIPVILLLLTRITAEKKGDRGLYLLVLAGYLYVIPSAAVLAVTGRLGFSLIPTVPDFNSAAIYINIIGFAVVLLTATAVLSRYTMLKTKNTSALNAAASLICILYPVAMALLTGFTENLTAGYKSSAVLALIIFTIIYTHFNIINKENSVSIIPEKLKREEYMLVFAFVFCLLIFFGGHS